jgi:hypothetical protein
MKRVWIAIVLLFVALAGVIGWRVARPSDEPVYKGKRLSEWLGGYCGEGKTTPEEADEAIRRMGTNAIPILLRLVRGSDAGFMPTVVSVARRLHIVPRGYRTPAEWNAAGAYGFSALGTNAHSAVPALIEIAKQNNTNSPGISAVYVLGVIGQPAREAIPLLRQWTTNADANLRRHAMASLYQIDRGAAAEAGITNASWRNLP